MSCRIYNMFSFFQIRHTRIKECFKQTMMPLCYKSAKSFLVGVDWSSSPKLILLGCTFWCMSSHILYAPYIRLSFWLLLAPAGRILSHCAIFLSSHVFKSKRSKTNNQRETNASENVCDSTFQTKINNRNMKYVYSNIFVLFASAVTNECARWCIRKPRAFAVVRYSHKAASVSWDFFFFAWGSVPANHVRSWLCLSVFLPLTIFFFFIKISLIPRIVATLDWRTHSKKEKRQEVSLG